MEESSAESNADENERGGDVNDPVEARLSVSVDGLDGSTVIVIVRYKVIVDVTVLTACDLDAVLTTGLLLRGSELPGVEVRQYGLFGTLQFAQSVSDPCVLDVVEDRAGAGGDGVSDGIKEEFVTVTSVVGLYSGVFFTRGVAGAESETSTLYDETNVGLGIPSVDSSGSKRFAILWTPAIRLVGRSPKSCSISWISLANWLSTDPTSAIVAKSRRV